MHSEALAVTDQWLHLGHIGRWVRTEAIAGLRESARLRGRKGRVELIILDPREESLCRSYAEYRDVLAYDDRDISSVEDVKLELIATLIHCIRASTDPRLDVELYFRSDLDFVRLDISSSVVFRTLVDPRNVAIVHHDIPEERRHSFFDAAVLSFDQAKGAAQKIDLASVD